MNAIAGIRPQPFAETTFAAFKVTHGLKRNPTSALDDLGHAATLDQALTAALTGRQALYHKDTLVIRETGEEGTRLHVYTIRKRAPAWVHVPGQHLPQRVADLYPDHVVTIDAGVVL